VTGVSNGGAICFLEDKTNFYNITGFKVVLNCHQNSYFLVFLSDRIKDNNLQPDCGHVQAISLHKNKLQLHINLDVLRLKFQSLLIWGKIIFDMLLSKVYILIVQFSNML
jgi:hypothetical protein